MLEATGESVFSSYHSLFVLSGEELSLPEAEINALAQSYEPKSSCAKIGGRVVACTISDESIIRKIEERAAYCRFGGTILGASQKLEALPEFVSDDRSPRTFALWSGTISKSKYAELGGAFKSRIGSKVSLNYPEQILDVEKTYDGYVLAGSDSGYKHFSWRTRRPRARKFFLPSAIYPKLARCLVNLSRCKEGDIFLDPFCGTGSLLIESAMMGMRTVGIDLTKWIARGCQLNLKGFSLDFDSVIRADSTSRFFPVARFDAVATDVPYGRASSTRGKTTDEIVRGFISTIRESMVRGKYCVIMHPAHVEFDFDRRKFVQIERHLLYVHRNLTRAITLLRSV